MLMAIPEQPETTMSSSLSPNTSSAGSIEGGDGRMMGGKPLPGQSPGGGSPGTMIINHNHQSGQSPRNNIPSNYSKIHEIRGDSDQSNPMLLRRVCPTSESSGGPSMNGVIPEFHMMDPLLQDHAFQQQLLQEFWENKRRQDEERDKLEALKNKDKNEQSAIASSEVKQKLQGFLLNKKQREAAAYGAAGTPTPGQPGPFPSHPYRRPMLMAKYEDDFPLRKTASEPNITLLKMRLKQRVLERRSSPLVRRKERSHIKRRSYLAMDGSGSAGSTPDSGPNSPPINCGIVGTPQSGSGGGTPQHDDSGGSGGSPYGHSAYGPTNSVCDLTLYSSPSLPNISLGARVPHSLTLGRPIPPNSQESKLAAVSETEVRCPIPPLSVQSGNGPLMPMPFYPPPNLPMDPAELEALYQSGGMMALTTYQAQALNAASQAQAEQLAQQQDPQRVGPGRTIHHRPLGRTQSAPLPLGHPMLVMNSVGMVNGITGSQIPGNPNMNQPPTTHQLLRNAIRQTVLTRAGSRGAVLGSLSRTVSVEEDSGEGEGEVDEQTQHIQQQQARSAYVNRMVQQHLLKHQQPPVPEGSTNIPGGTNVVSAIPQRLHHTVRPLSRALSSPLVALGSPGSPQDVLQQTMSAKPGGTGLAFDNIMLKHQCLCGDNSQHPEHAGRLQSIWARLQETGLIGMCERIRTRKATLEEIQVVHSEAHTLLFGTNPLSRQRLELSRFPESSLPIKSLVRLPCNGIGVDSDTAWNEIHTPAAARMAVGCVMELAFRVAAGELRNGFAIVRPPGHHAEPVQAMGFCFFNAVAITAKLLRARFQLEKIMIVDWDVHHGNGTQQIFYDDPHVLYMSIHRHDDGNFFPGTGAVTECGHEDGMGFTVNIPWSGGLNPPMGDAEYMAAFRSVVMPIANDFQPDVILVSCGFDAAAGHPAPLGGYKVTPACFGWMVQQLMTVGHGKVVLALEGGYDLPAICDSSQECVKALLGEQITPIPEEELLRTPSAPAVDTLLQTMTVQKPHWPCIKRSLVSCSAVEAAATSMEGKILLRERVESETVTANMASLSMHNARRPSEATTRSNDSESSDVSASINSSSKVTGRRSSDMNMNEDNTNEQRVRGDSEEPMEQEQ
ncbi:histone deacetylase 4 isoform X4 [Folsomia candida]|uniref:histone deacetylase 4 isoform X4 n=1 Tax=Folsomia candida TaxID=158441 RepID=UPI000B8F2F6A|nr:histone deacetylase 4 isoform X4 [Folsomia candida]